MNKEIDDILEQIGSVINELKQVEHDAGDMSDKVTRDEAYNQRMSLEKAYDIIEDIRNVRLV